VLAAPEIAHQLGLAFLAVGLVQHGVIHAQHAAFQVQQGARLLKQVPAAEGLAVQKSVGRIMGKLAAGHFGQSHATRTLRLGQKESRVMLQSAFGRRGFAQRAHGQKVQYGRELRPLKRHGA
jgi:hypothetical protein